MENKIIQEFEDNGYVTIELTNCNATPYHKVQFFNLEKALYFYNYYRNTVEQGFLVMYIY